jgi:O-acetyl-ADP-ribose deacetylase (regulator of RNase III)
MIHHDGRGNLFESQCHTLVCPINVVGVMGKGLAKTFAQRFDGLLEFYRSHYPRTEDPDPTLIEKLVVYRPADAYHQVLLFPTKLHWRDPSQPNWVDRNLERVVDQWFELDLQSVAFPAVGCGEGGLSFEWVRRQFQRRFQTLMLDVELYWPA